MIRSSCESCGAPLADDAWVCHGCGCVVRPELFTANLAENTSDRGDDDDGLEERHTLRADLIVQQQGEQFIIKDPLRNNFGRLGAAEFLVATQFDGKSSLEQIRARLREERDIVIPAEALLKFRDRLHQMKYIVRPGESVAREDQALGSSRGLLDRLILIPIPVKINPDLFLSRLHDRAGRFIFRPAYVFFTIIAAIAAIQIWLEQWDRILLQAQTLGTVKSLITFWFVFAISVSLHEIAHGLTTKAFGGQVRRMGVFLYFLNVAFYTDVSDAWLFPSKLRQFLVIWAGAYTTLVLCVLATILWRITIPGTELNEVLFIFMTFNAFAAGFTLTPFLRGDGYYMTSCLLDIPNLREKSFEYGRAWFKRLLLRGTIALPKATRREARIFLIYAITTFVFLAIFLSLAAYKVIGFLFGRFEILGFVLVAAILYDRVGGRLQHAVFGALLSVLKLRRKTSRSAGPARAQPSDPPPLAAGGARPSLREYRRGAITAGVVVLALAAIAFMPYELTISAPFQVIAMHSTAVRTRVEGVLSEILVASGESVRKGQVVARVLDRDLSVEWDRLQAEVAQVEAQRKLRQRGFRPEEIERARLAVERIAARVAQRQRAAQREKRLHAEQIVPLESLQVAQSRLRAAQRELEQAEQELQRLEGGFREEEIATAESEADAVKERLRWVEQRLEWTSIVAETDGIVATPEHELEVRLGGFVRPGDEILQIVDPARLRARILVQEQDFGEVAVNQEVSLRAYQAPLERFASNISAVEDEIYQQRFVPVIAQAGDSDSSLRLGMSGVAKIECGRSTLVYFAYRRLLRAYFVRLWAWW